MFDQALYEGYFCKSFTIGDEDKETPALVLYGNRGENASFDFSIKYSNLMITEDNVDQTYEPYYVTSNVKVTQNKNHTLKAIWQKN